MDHLPLHINYLRAGDSLYVSMEVYNIRTFNPFVVGSTPARPTTGTPVDIEKPAIFDSRLFFAYISPANSESAEERPHLAGRWTPEAEQTCDTPSVFGSQLQAERCLSHDVNDDFNDAVDDLRQPYEIRALCRPFLKGRSFPSNWNR